MSQITRCPSCATSFKVVADQLRISEGWVRCGQCKEVFDAAAHLLPAPPPPLLPDVSLTDVRPPMAPVVRKSDAGRAWGTRAAAVSSQSPVPVPFAPVADPAPVPAAPVYAAAEFSLFESAPPVVAADTAPQAEPLSVPVHIPESVPGHESVLAVPDPTVPAFLAAARGADARNAVDLRLEPLTPFAWRAREKAPDRQQPAPPADVGATGLSGMPMSASPEGFVQSQGADVGSLPPAWADPKVAIPRSPGTAPAAAAPAAQAASASMPLSVPAGYELPFADLRDDGELLEMPSFEETAPADLTPMGYPALELPIRPGSAPPVAAAAPEVESGRSPGPDLGASKRAPAPSAKEPVAEGSGLPAVDFVQEPRESAQTPAPAPALSLVDDTSPAAVLQPRTRKVARDEPVDDEDEDPQAETEVGFVVAARRKAFWRRPAVRGVLVLVLLISTAALVLQVAVQERDRIVAMDARARPWLMKLCAPLGCDIAPQRQIADMVIDSSSFNKARGDSYQLTMGVKSKASIVLAMPAVELTLTDAQDQPILRRVLLPADMGAPSELPARGEWSTSVSVVVTTGGARVAGYRLLAFYP
ncbi:zinc-ribbon and DUF3426 domain-containing protein [Acidovorax sp. sic0104]|uniref:zinc-ribbon and DUF3426 domain-containing protein n=1 Tax=Acidovorax sp. sic0104 TaxID=2854784 RepID=UPI001C47C350|nr:zinc-ribbon and DUF3426 domain-containing protein [Acidovorax sp. sic0104]MBV7541279.1 DUF3426 domain-containing protein [Acidovorax sp. sic0104]